jgi:alanine racemase
MSTATLIIDLAAIARNWRNLNAQTTVETAAVVKANAYGLGMDEVAKVLAQAGAREFFVAVAEEGARLRSILGPGPRISVLSGHMDGDTSLIRSAHLTPMLNSIYQMVRHFEALPGHRFGLQLDTGMNRLGMEDAEWRALRGIALSQKPTLVMSHLACADDPAHPMNQQQLTHFRKMTQGVDAPRSLAATGGLLMGADYHFDLTRPGIGLYGGLPYLDANPVVSLVIPVIQIRDVAEGETVGYSNTWTAQRPSRIATISAGYADGLIRAMGGKARLHTGRMAVPVVGRISMDLIGVDVTDAKHDPEQLELIGAHQSVDTVAGFAGTIGYEILTSLGTRYNRVYLR